MPGAPLILQNHQPLENLTTGPPPKRSIFRRRYLILLTLLLFPTLVFLFNLNKSANLISIPSPLPEFVGRKKIIQEIQRVFCKKDEYHLPIAVLWGEAGIGKTETAIKFSRDHVQDHSLVYWINVGSKEIYQQSYYDLANHLRIPIGQRMPFEKIREKVHYILENDIFKKPWLLIYDNADEAFELPKRGNGRILITTRNKELWKNGAYIELPPLSEADSRELFLGLYPNQSPEEWSKLAKELDFFPLALHQALQYLKESPHFSLADYRAMLCNNQGAIFKYSSLNDRYTKDLALMWEMSLNNLAEASPNAYEWLMICGHLHPDKIPLNWVEQWLIEDKKIDENQAKLEANEILRLLVSKGCVRLNKDNQSFAIHRLKQNLFNSDSERSREVKKKVLLFLRNQVKNFIFHDQLEWNEDVWNRLINWELNASWVLSKHPNHMEFPCEIGHILNVIGNFNVTFKGRYAEGEQIYDRALALLQQAKETQSELIFTYLNRSFCFFRLGKFDQAKISAQEALALAEKMNPNIETLEKSYCLTSLASLYIWLDDAKQALFYSKQAVELQKALFNSEVNVQVCEAIKWLGSAYGMLGQDEFGVHFTKKALAINEQIFGDNPNIQRCCILNNLGQLYCKIGQIDQALECHFKVYQMDKKIFSHEFFMPIVTLTDIAIEYRLKDQYWKSLYYTRKALKFANEIYPDLAHPTCLRALDNLANTYLDQGRPRKALPLFELILEKANSFLENKNHDIYYKAYFGKGNVYRALSNYSQAIENYEKALEISQNQNLHSQRNVLEVLRALKDINEKVDNQKSEYYSNWILQIKAEIL